MYDSVIKLVSEVATIDDYGDQIVEETEREIFAELKSIGQSEFYQAQAIGIKPELKFVIADYLDYHNEKKIKYKAFDSDIWEEYFLLRTYRTGNELELVCKKGID